MLNIDKIVEQLLRFKGQTISIGNKNYIFHDVYFLGVSERTEGESSNLKPYAALVPQDGKGSPKFKDVKALLRNFEDGQNA